MPSALTRAAEGYPRRAFTVDEIIAMQDAGISVTRKGPEETLSCAAVPEFKFRLVDA